MARVTLEKLLERSVKNMGKVDPVVKNSTLEMIKRAYDKGINVQISAGMRTYAEQDALYAKGRTAPGNIVTKARAGYSNHNFGLAVDYFLVSHDGNVGHWDITRDMNANDVADWLEVANIAKSLGFEWGGDWKSFVDYPHLQMVGGLSTAQLRAGKRPNLVSKVKNPIKVVTKPTHKKVSGPVADYQKWLNKNYSVDLDVDNIYGPLTNKAAIKAYQVEMNKQYGAHLKVDGIYGHDSRNTTLNVKRGARGNITRIIQGLLICKGYDVKGFDGIFGAGLEAAVKRFQKANGLYVDGIVGVNTFVALLK